MMNGAYDAGSHYSSLITHQFRREWWQWLLLLVALLVFVAQLWLASPTKSAAFDEQYHLVTGYSYLITGDFRLATNHPPLMGLLAALPLWGRSDIVLPLDHPAWQAGDRFLFSDVFLWEANADPQGMLLAARRPIMLVGVLLVLGLYCWARQMIGAKAGWLVLALAIFDPNLLANARVVTTDLGLTCFLCLATWRLWCWLEERSARNLFLVGLWAGLAMCAKYNGLFFWPSALIITLLYPATQATDTYGRRWLGLVGMGLVGLTVVWALYRFDVGPMTNGPIHWPLPAPFYWQQLYNTFFRIVDLQGARYDFFWGEAGNHGWWAYFPVALAVKTPLPLLILAAVGSVVMLRQQGWRRASVLYTLPLLFLIFGLSGILTIGYRHILPVIPFLILSAGYAVNPTLTLPNLGWELSSRQQGSSFAPDPVRATLGRVRVGFVVLLLLWAVVDTLHIFPHQEAFFNELAGDWYNWSNLLVDSNLDWGQDLPALRQVMTERGIAEVNLAYFGKAAPEKYDIHYRPLPGYLRFVEGAELNAYNPYQPEPGWYAISATSLRLGLLQADSLELYAYFRDKRPDTRAGYSIYLYHVSDPANLHIVRKVVVGEPVYHLTPDALGITPGARVQVKWLQTPDAAIYPVGTSFTAPNAHYQAVNANFSENFTLLGVAGADSVAHPGQVLALTLYWQVGRQPLTMPAPTRGAALSAFVHLTVPTDPGQKIAQFDGWPTAVRGLEPGDVIAQPLTLDISPDAAPGRYMLLVGLYSPQSFARLMVTNQGEAQDAARVGEVVVE
jgi:4-amino-4-deoxy-L-arabinose transferase-like glycosyltransferase